MEENKCLVLKNKNITNDDLLAIGKEMYKLDKNEEIFYKDY